MPGRLRDVLDDVLGPPVDWLRRRKWWFKACLVLAALLGVLALRFPPVRSALTTSASSVDRCVRVLVWGQEHPPIRSSIQAALRGSITNLASALSPLVHGPNFAGQAWTTSQVIVATLGLVPLDSGTACQYLERESGPGTPAWCKWREPGRPPHTAATAWVALAYARMASTRGEAAVRFLVSSQHVEGENVGGWWAIYDGAYSDERNASSYATAISVLALLQQLESGMLAAGLRDSVQRTVDLGVSWLQRTKLPDRARWFDYPLRPGGHESVSISGLVLHALHRHGGLALDQYDRQWLRGLPKADLSATEPEMSGWSIGRPDGSIIASDDTRYYQLQWAAIATADAYRSGSLREKIAGLAWLEDGVGRRAPRLVPEVLKVGEWVAAETLIAFRRVIS